MSPQKKEGKVSSSKTKTSELKKFYRENFPDLKIHHLIPRSRGGQTDYFVLFPWDFISHDAWHQLCLNMTVQEVWDRLDEIHATIYSSADMVVPFWLKACTLYKAGPKKLAKFEEQKKDKLSRPVNAVKLRGLWLRCFKSDKLADARTLLLYMAMFMLFGSKMADPESISQADAESLLSQIPDMQDYRRWAAGICLNYAATVIVSRVSDFYVSPR